jgi:hypothetical protein
MARHNNTDRNGNSFSEETKKAVWNKAQIVSGYDSTRTRKDACGAWIYWDQYGNITQNGGGWEIDHIKPVSKGGGDELDNLQPLQWQNNRMKGDDYPTLNYCIITSS